MVSTYERKSQGPNFGCRSIVDFPCQPLEENGGDDDDSQGDDDDTSGDGDDDGGWGCRWMHHERGGTTAGAFGVFLVMLGLVRRRRG